MKNCQPIETADALHIPPTSRQQIADDDVSDLRFPAPRASQLPVDAAPADAPVSATPRQLDGAAHPRLLLARRSGISRRPGTGERQKGTPAHGPQRRAVGGGVHLSVRYIQCIINIILLYYSPSLFLYFFLFLSFPALSLSISLALSLFLSFVND